MDRTAAATLMDEIKARAHATASLALASGGSTLTGLQPEVLELGIASGIIAAFDVLVERGLLPREEEAG